MALIDGGVDVSLFRTGIAGGRYAGGRIVGARIVGAVALGFVLTAPHAFAQEIDGARASAVPVVFEAFAVVELQDGVGPAHGDYAPSDGAPSDDAPSADQRDAAPDASAPNGAASQPDEPGPDVAARATATFDGATWARRLAVSDLAARERAFDELSVLAAERPRVRAWVREQARVGTGELAWTCRMLDRSLFADERLARLERVLDARRGENPAREAGRTGARYEATWTEFLVDAEAAPMVVPLGLPARPEAAEKGASTWTVEHHRVVFTTSFVGANGERIEDAEWIVEALVPSVPWARPIDLDLAPPGTAGADGRTGSQRGPLLVRDDAGDFAERGRQRAFGDGATSPSAVRISGAQGSGVQDSGAQSSEAQLRIRATFGSSARLVAAPSFDRLGVRVHEIAPEGAAEGAAPSEENASEADASEAARSDGSATGVITAGLPVLDVATGSIAHVLGLARGDRLLAIDGRTLADANAISAALAEAARRGQIRVAWYSAAAGEILERCYVGVPSTGTPGGFPATAPVTDAPATPPPVVEPATRDALEQVDVPVRADANDG